MTSSHNVSAHIWVILTPLMSHFNTDEVCIIKPTSPQSSDFLCPIFRLTGKTSDSSRLANLSEWCLIEDRHDIDISKLSARSLICMKPSYKLIEIDQPYQFLPAQCYATTGLQLQPSVCVSLCQSRLLQQHVLTGDHMLLKAVQLGRLIGWLYKESILHVCNYNLRDAPPAIREIVVDFTTLGAFTGKSCFGKPHQVFKGRDKKWHFALSPMDMRNKLHDINGHQNTHLSMLIFDHLNGRLLIYCYSGSWFCV